MSTATQPALNIWMSEKELSDLERESGQRFASVKEAHIYRLRKLAERQAAILVYGTPIDSLLQENADHLERDRQEYRRGETLRTINVGIRPTGL